MGKKDKLIKHTISKKDLEINEGALEQAGIKEGDEIQFPAEEELVEITATQNTYLADGTFVSKGDKVKVLREYAERLKKEKANNFK